MTSPPEDDRSLPKPTLRIDGKLQAHIGQQLRTFYATIVSEPVPDRFKALLDQLENTEKPTPTESPPGPVAKYE